MRADCAARFGGKHSITRRVSSIAVSTPPGPLSALAGTVYEVNLLVNADAVAPFDTWLADHVGEMAAIDGFTSAKVLHPDADADAAASGEYSLCLC